MDGQVKRITSAKKNIWVVEMSSQLSIPVIFALVAFFIADSENRVISEIFQRTLKIGNRAEIEERLSKLGRKQKEDYENFRISQLVYISTGMLFSTIALFIGLVSWITYGLSLFVITFGVFALTERNLKERCEKRLKDIEGEFPSVIEMLTLAVGAGESPASALKRISIRARGLLASEFEQVIVEIENGRSLTVALDDLSKRLSSDAIRRFVDSLAISISRGSSLVETLSHSSSESRNQERIRLLTASGKSEISMMIPVVFLILPVSILFALYPSLTNLNLFGSS
jgi:tight adherence protein C